MNKQRPTVILLVGICLCAICALFPPRRFIGNLNYPTGAKNSSVTRALLFSEDFGVFETNQNGAIESWPVELDDGRLLAEIVLIASLTGILVLVPKLKRNDA